jgi:hypothetical protein
MAHDLYMFTPNNLTSCFANGTAHGWAGPLSYTNITSEREWCGLAKTLDLVVGQKWKLVQHNMACVCPWGAGGGGVQAKEEKALGTSHKQTKLFLTMAQVLQRKYTIDITHKHGKNSTSYETSSKSCPMKLSCWEVYNITT